MQPLDPLQLPLAGTQLLEASAGTGKTYTLALLFLRLVVERGLSVAEILVVTFTRAATAELRDRIRHRLREALSVLEGRGKTDKEDKLLAAVLGRVEPAIARQRLTDGLVRMDEAAIHTIHGFCQRVLQEQAFEASTPFAMDLMEGGDQILREQFIADFWRNRFYGTADAEAAWALATWGGPEGMLAQLKPAMTAECILLPAIRQDTVDTRGNTARQAFARLQAVLASERDEAENILRENGCLKRGAADYRLADCVPALLRILENLAAAPEMPYALDKLVSRLGWSFMAQHLKKKCDASPENPLFHEVDAFLAVHADFVNSLRCLLLRQARDFVMAKLAARKEQLGLMTFDDLLHRLDTALSLPGSGERLAARLRAQAPAALVDEFQDTDPVQYRIFSRIYAGRSDTLFCMIGDPKQAIYSFRGADIFTYLKAHRETSPGSRYTMAVNYRSTPAMVQAVNSLFSLRDDAFGLGESILFQPVLAAPDKAAPVLLHGEPLPPLSALLLDDATFKAEKKNTLNKENALAAAVLFCTEQLVALLAAGARGEATLDGRSLKAADIAVLVRTHREAAAMQAGLRKCGVHSLCLDQESVFASCEATDMLRLLEALAEPGDSGCVRGALTTALFGVSAEELMRLREDDALWSARLQGIERYRQQVHEQGFMAMFQHLLARENVTSRLTAWVGGERSLTNYLHLAELVQESPLGEHGVAALLRWFAQQVDQPDKTSEAHLVRLESDEQLIRIITMHQAKGLEFPVVFLPCLWAAHPLRDGAPLQFHDRQRFQQVVDWSGTDANQTLAEEERLAEELRLLYVAVTRAKSCCFFAWGLVNNLQATGLAHLLHRGGMPTDEAAMEADLKRLNAQEQLLALHHFPQNFFNDRPDLHETSRELAVRSFTGRILPGWTITSYSRLSGDMLAGDSARQDERRTDFAALAEDFRTPATFPRGTVAGTFLHSVLERLDFSRPALNQAPLSPEALAQAGIDPRWQHGLADWIDQVLAVQLPGACPLNQVGSADRITELNFLFPLQQMDLRGFADILQQAGFRAPVVTSASLQGLMKGFIDLVFRHGGCYCIVDYKSNYLGPSPAEYTEAALEAGMDAHRYHLQLLIYTLALHRFLGARLSGYQYQTHVGSAYYLFLRGMTRELPGSGVFTLRPEEELILALDDCCRGGMR